MRLVFIYGPPAAGKLTIARRLSEDCGFPVFHNHLVVDAVMSVFPFGDPDFVRLRERFWLETLEAAAKAGRSLIFTFQPEATVAPDFPQRVRALVERAGGRCDFVRLTLDLETQAKRIDAPSRSEFGKLKDAGLLRDMHASFLACEAAMPDPAISIDTGRVDIEDAARKIEAALGLGEA